MSRWTKADVPDRMYQELQRAQFVQVNLKEVSQDSTCHRQVTRQMKRQDSDGCRGCWNGRDVLPLARAGARHP